MTDLLGVLVKGFGISHLNALLILVIAYFVWRGFARIIKVVERHSDQMTDMYILTKGMEQRQLLHEGEDSRRFDNLQGTMDDIRRNQ